MADKRLGAAGAAATTSTAAPAAPATPPPGPAERLFRFFAEDRNSAAQWRAADATVAKRAQAVEQAHAAANALGEAGKTQTEMGIRARRRRCERGRDGGTTYAPLWRIWRVLRPSWRGLWRGDEIEAAEC
jgi:hypothetical protein